MSIWMRMDNGDEDEDEGGQEDDDEGGHEDEDGH